MIIPLEPTSTRRPGHPPATTAPEDPASVYPRQPQTVSYHYVTLTVSRPSYTQYTTILLGTVTDDNKPGALPDQTSSSAPAAQCCSTTTTTTPSAAAGDGASSDGDSARTALIIVGVLLGIVFVGVLWCCCCGSFPIRGGGRGGWSRSPSPSSSSDRKDRRDLRDRQGLRGLRGSRDRRDRRDHPDQLARLDRDPVRPATQAIPDGYILGLRPVPRRAEGFMPGLGPGQLRRDAFGLKPAPCRDVSMLEPRA
ncbi:hypothetical protein C8A03DRAFT_30381 [Achaetomium macrosporum]|uniref:Uncharacterized protein n=1 Tax=Achaetomium macrosporum TaxID=79813 RepID=A0AAN7HI58_9PEZI|nr:hypothetical protein C8A03DRAFT_30381 [Achaetomium macrosporum]